MNKPDSARIALSIEGENWPLRNPFCIAGKTWVNLIVAVVTLEQGTCVGRGEAAGVFYREDDVPAMVERIEHARDAIERGIDRAALQRLLPPGGARNAVDCALWDLEAQLSGRCAWEIAGLGKPVPLL